MKPQRRPRWFRELIYRARVASERLAYAHAEALRAYADFDVYAATVKALGYDPLAYRPDDELAARRSSKEQAS